MNARTLAPLLLLVAGCSSEELLHGLDEPQANDVLVALEEEGVAGGLRRDDGTDAAFTVTVPARDAAKARRILSERELPRPRSQGFADLFAEGGMVPTPAEEHARYLHALSGELSRSVATLDGVVEARVHLGLPQDDPLRPGDRRPPRAAVLVRCRPAACGAVRAMEAGIRALVAGAADGLSPEAVSVLVAEAGTAAVKSPAAPSRAPWRAVAAAALGAAALFLGLVALKRRLGWRVARPDEG
ncbi:MAG TPA: secretion protein [Anaeromyxobacteraceae bacterium]|nr:secretion protein [Anaeromyxobacteraceae bacterium]